MEKLHLYGKRFKLNIANIFDLLYNIDVNLILRKFLKKKTKNEEEK